MLIWINGIHQGIPGTTNMPKRFLVLQHSLEEEPGSHLLLSAKKHKIDLDIIRLWDQKIPSLSSYDALLVLGGNPNLDQEDLYPFLKDAKQAIKKWILNDRPFLGISLGHQLLAECLGAKVGDNYCTSVGFIHGYLTKKGKTHPIFKNLPPCLTLFKWHSQTVMQPIPRTLAILATSAECQIEAISIKNRPHIIGLQFDNNTADAKCIKKFIDKNPTRLSALTSKNSNLNLLTDKAAAYNNTIASQYDQIFANFIALT